MYTEIIATEKVTRWQELGNDFDLGIAGPKDEDSYEANVEIRADYSGRGMYGDSCFGVVVASVSEFVKFLLIVAEDDQELAWELASHAKEDSMGYSTIYYFPGYQIASDDED